MVIPIAVAALAGAGVQAYGAQVQKKAAKKAKRIQKRLRGIETALQEQEMAETEGDITRKYERAVPDLQAQLAEQGLSDSSFEQEAQGDLDYERANRMRAISRARVRLREGNLATEKLEKLEEKLARTMRNLALVQSFLGGGVTALGQTASTQTDQNPSGTSGRQ